MSDPGVKPALPGVTPAEFAAGLKSLAAFPFQHLIHAAEARFANFGDDMLALEDIVMLLGDFGLPFAGDAEVALRVAAFVLPAIAALPAAPTVANPSGAVGGPFDGKVPAQPNDPANPSGAIGGPLSLFHHEV